jgi:hypothetical protein
MSDIVSGEMREKVKSFWARKEGKTGMIILGLLGGGILYKALPYIRNASELLAEIGENGFVTFAYAVGIFLIYEVVSNKTVQAFTKVAFEGVCYQITDAAIGINPVAIAKGALAKLKEMIEIVSEKRTKLDGKKEQGKQAIERNNQEIQKRTEEANKIAKAGARKKELALKNNTEFDEIEYTVNISVETNQIERLQKYNAELAPFVIKMDEICEKLHKIEVAANAKYRDLDNYAKLQIQKRSMMQDLKSAIDSARAVLKGGQIKDMYDRSMMRMVEDFDRDMGEVNSFINDIAPILDKIDRDDDAAAADALARIDSFMTNNQFIAGAIKQYALPAGDTSNVLQIPSADAVNEEDKYAKVLNPVRKNRQ